MHVCTVVELGTLAAYLMQSYCSVKQRLTSEIERSEQTVQRSGLPLVAGTVVGAVAMGAGGGGAA